MTDLRTLARPLLAAPFVMGGYQGWKAAEPLAPVVADVVEPIAERVGLPKDPKTLVKINAGVQIGAGVLLATGRLPRLAALALAVTIVPTTAAGHRFWEQHEPAAKAKELMQFAKNAGLLGGLLVAVLDTRGRPSVFWAGRQAARHAASAISETVAKGVDGAHGLLPN